MKHARIFSKIMSVVLAMAMVASMLPMSVLATQTGRDVGIEETQVELDLSVMSDEEIAALCVELAQAENAAALESIAAQLAEDEARYKAVELLVMAELGIEEDGGDVAPLANDPATVTAYKLVSDPADKQVDLKYYEYVGTAADLEAAVTLLEGNAGGLIEISEGTLTVTNRQDITMSNLVIKGAGKTATTLTGNASNFNNKTNGLNSSNLSSEYKALLGISAENVKVMDMTIDGGDCGVLTKTFGVATGAKDFKTVRVNGCTAYLEDLVISGKNARTILMVGTSTGTATVHANGVTVNRPSYLLSAATEQTYGSYLDAKGSLLEGIVLGSGANLGAGYYEVTYSGVTAYTTIPYAIEIYENGLLTPGFVNAQTTAQGTTVAEAMTADLTTVIDGSTTLLYGKDCDEMKALAGEFKTVLASLSDETGVEVQECLARLTTALAVDSWHGVEADGTCAVCGKTGLSIPAEKPSVDVEISEDIVVGDASGEEVGAAEQTTIIDRVVTNNEAFKTGFTKTEEVDQLSVKATAMTVSNGVATKMTFDVTPMLNGAEATLSKAITFRLPVDANVTAAAAAVFHEDELLGTDYAIEGDANGKYVEVTAADFSLYTVDTAYEEPAVAKNVEVTDAEGNVSTYPGFANFSTLDLANCTIKLLGDVSDANLILNKGDVNVVLDLNGFTFSRAGSSSGAISLIEGAGLTIRDSGTAQTGKVYADTYVVWIMNGDLVLESGTLETTSTKNPAIYANATEMSVVGGKIVSANDAIRVGDNFLESRGASTITISDGEIVAAGCGVAEGDYSQAKTKLTVTGGVIDSEKDSISITTGAAAVSGGTFSSDVSAYVTDGFELKQNADGTYGVAETIAAVAEINGVGYATFAEALAAAKTMTGDITVEILDKVTMNANLTGSFESITFVGKDTDAEIYMDIQGAVYATGKTVAFEDLTLSKVAGGYVADAGFMNLAFGVYNADEVTYTNCTFANGAYASYGVNTFTGCTFYRSHDRYGLWAYGAEEVIVDGCTFADIRGIKVYDEGKLRLTSLTVTDTDFSAVDNKPAIVLTSGKSVTLSGNTYNPDKGVFELDLDGNPDGTAVTSDVAPTCINDNGACGVLVDGKIYTTVAQAAAVATSGSEVTLLHESAETVEFAEGVELDKNGFTAAGVTVKQTAVANVAEVNGVEYATLSAAFAAVTRDDDTVTILSDVTEELTGAYLRGNIVAEDDVTITLTNTDWVYMPYTFVLGENITLKAPALFYYAGGAQINGTVVAGAYYQAYAGTKLTINEPGSMTVTSETFILRSVQRDPNAGIYVVGDNNDETIGLNTSVIYFYQGMINAKDATIKTAVYWQTNETDGEGSANLVLDNTKMNVTVNEQNVMVTGNSTATLINGSNLTCTGEFTYGENAVISVDATSGIYDKNGQVKFETPVAKIGDAEYATIQAAVDAAEAGQTVTVIADVSDEAVTVDKNLTITGSVTLTNVSINANGADKLTVSGLTFAGNSWINSGSAEKLTVSGVTANVTPSNAAQTNSRSAFISLGRSESQQLELVVENCDIVVPSGTNPILGWAAITGATITDSTFGSASAYQNSGDSIKFMGIADGAVITITGNTVYSNYNGIVFAQNTTRGNAYTANLSGNTFVGGADHVWVEVSGSGTCNASINAASNNTVNGNAFTAADIKLHPDLNTFTGYMGVDVVTNAAGKVIGGTLAFYGEDAIAEGYVSVKQADGTYLVGKVPNAEVKNLGTITVKNNEGDYKFDGSYYIYDLVGGTGLKSANAPFDATIAMEFIAKDTAEQAAANAFGGYTTDFFITMKGMSQSSFVGNGCYLVGYYPSFGTWVVIPLDGFTVENEKVYPVITSAGFDFSYEMICDQVEQFVCGIYLTPEVLKANPNLTVDLALGLSENKEAALNADFVTVDNYVYDADDLMPGLTGSGTETDPYMIMTLDDLILFRDSVNAGDTKYNAEGVYVALGADIDMAGADWSVNIGDDCNATFDGIFDGRNHTLCNLTAVETAKKADGYVCGGLFGAIYGSAVVKNLTLKNVTIDAGFTGNNVGAVVGFAYNCTGSVENVKVTGDIAINAAAVTGVGAIVGYDYYGKLTVANCSVIGNDGSYITGAAYVGGVIGYASSNSVVSGGCVENVAITATSCAAGGIAGIMLGTGKVTDSSVKNVALVSTHANWQNAAAAAVGTISGGAVTVSNVTVENVTANGAATTALVGSQHADKPATPLGKVEARIGDVYYATLEAALAAAQTGETVELLAPIVVAAGESLTLNKAVTIAYTSNVPGEDMITNRGTLVIDGATLVYTNTDTTGSNVTVSTISCEPGSVLTVNSGVVKNDSANNSNSGAGSFAYAIDLITNGGLGDVTVTINGGEVISTNYMAIRQFVNGETCKNTLTVNGGTIQGATRGINIQLKNNMAYTTINGGTIEGGDYALCFLTTSENLSVMGGEFKGKVWYSGTDGFITGGTFDTDVTDYCAEGYTCEQNADGTYGVVEESLFEITKNNMVMGENLALLFAFEKRNIVDEDLSDYVAKVSVAYKDVRGTVNSEIMAAEWAPVTISGAEYWMVTVSNLAAKEMDDDVTVTIFKGDEAVSEPKTMSLRAYGEDRLAASSNAKFKTTVVDMLNYGAEAQLYFEYNTENLANRNLTDEQKMLATESVVLDQKREIISDPDSHFLASNVKFESDISMMFAVLEESAAVSAKITFVNHMKKDVVKEVDVFDVIKANGKWVKMFTFTGMVVADIDQVITVEFFDAEGNELLSLTDSLDAYLGRIKTSSDMYNLAQAFGRFSTSAHAYLHRNDT